MIVNLIDLWEMGLIVISINERSVCAIIGGDLRQKGEIIICINERFLKLNHLTYIPMSHADALSIEPFSLIGSEQEKSNLNSVVRFFPQLLI